VSVYWFNGANIVVLRYKQDIMAYTAEEIKETERAFDKLINVNEPIIWGEHKYKVIHVFQRPSHLIKKEEVDRGCVPFTVMLTLEDISTHETYHIDLSLFLRYFPDWDITTKTFNKRMF